MGATELRITERQAGEPRPKPDTIPTSPEAIAVARLFGRDPEKEWSDAEIGLFRKLRTRKVLTMESVALLTRYYEAERKKGDEGFHRRDLMRFLKFYDGELDKAKAHKPRPLSCLVPVHKPKIVVMGPPLTEAERQTAAQFQKTL